MYTIENKNYLKVLVNNKVLIRGERNIGKTTVLKNVVDFCEEQNLPYIIIDTATEHPDKSILIYAKQKYNKFFELNGNMSVAEFEEKLTFIKNNKVEKIYFDASYFLEMSYDYKFLKSKIIRQKYKKQIEKFLLFIKNLSGKYYIISDEIEYTKPSLEYLEKFNLITTIHNYLYPKCYKNRFIEFTEIDDFYNDIILNSNTKDLLCGNLCLEYILLKNSRKKCFWFFDIVKQLKKQFRLNIEYTNSSLMRDYYSGELNKKLKRKIKYVESLISKTSANLENFQIRFNEYSKCILLVGSASFNCDENMSGGHYIIIQKIENEFYLLNPNKNKLRLQKFEMQKLLNDCNSFGGFKIFIGEKYAKRRF